MHALQYFICLDKFVYLIGLFKLCKIGEDKNLSVMTSVELKKLFPRKKVETTVSLHYTFQASLLTHLLSFLS